MRTMFLAVTLAVLSVIYWPANTAIAQETQVARGTVSDMSGSSITIVGGSGGGATFEQTFQISTDTKVVGKGLGTATAASGGKALFSELIAAGDQVSVAYHKVGNRLQASDVRVTTKK